MNIFNFLSSLKAEDKITLFGIIITVVVSIITLLYSIKNNKSVQYMDAVTKSRIDWIQKLRDLVSEFIAKTNVYNNAYYRKNFDKSGEHLSECQNLCSSIKLLLNCCDQRDKNIATLCELILKEHRMYTDTIHNLNVDKSGYFIESDKSKKLKKSIEDNISELTKQVQIYLKAEWNRVKYESNGKIYETETQQFDLLELKNKYDNPSYENDIWKRTCINTKAKIKRLLKSPGTYVIIFVILIVPLIFYLIIK